MKNLGCKEADQLVKELWAELYKKNVTPHPYRKDDPSCIQKKAMSDVHRKNVTPHVYRENDPTSIQKEPSWALNEVTID